MNEIKRLDKRGVYRVERGIKGIEYRLIEGLRSKEGRKRLREGIGIKIIRKRQKAKE
jgi:hypothetical protein